MKKIQLIALCTLALAGCKNDKSDNITTNALPDLNASIEQIDTRTSLDANREVVWTANDRVSVFAASTGNNQYKVTGGAGTTIATLQPISTTSVSGSAINCNIAFYPYSASTVCAAGLAHKLTVGLPSTQSFAAAGFGQGANAMAAITAGTSDKSYAFKNLSGALKIQLKGTAAITKIELTGNSGEKLSGAATVVLSSGGTPQVTMDSGASQSVVLDCGTGVQLNSTTATDFYIVVPPATFSSGITVTITDNEGNKMTKSTDKSLTVNRSKIKPMEVLTFEAAAENIVFEDANFKAALLLMTIDGNLAADNPSQTKVDANGDGEISTVEAAAVTAIDFDPYANNVTSLADIKYFTNITYLRCRSRNVAKPGSLTSLDLSTNTKLKYLDCSDNQLTSIDVSKCVALYSLRCNSNKLTSIDPSNCPELNELICYNNNIASLNLSNCTALEELYCYINLLTSLDVSKNTSLCYLYCNDNNLTSLDLGKNTSLGYLQCYNNKLTTLDVSKTDLHNSEYFAPLKCSPMYDDKWDNMLQTLYIGTNQVIMYINGTGDYARNDNYIPAETTIVKK